MDNKQLIERSVALKERAEGFWLVRAVQSWMAADGMRMSAAMAFYAMLSLAPLLVLVVAGLGWWLDRSTVESTLINQVQAVTGERAASVVRQALSSATTKSEGIIASLIAFGVLLSAATGVFVALQDALKAIWGSNTEIQRPWWWILVVRLRGVGYMLVLGGLLFASLVMSAVLKVVASWLDGVLTNPWFWSLLNETVSFLFVVLLFTGLMRISDGPKPSLRYLVVGGMMGAVLFIIGKHVMAMYLSGAAVVSAYGAAGSLVALLMWLYFSSAILLLSASFAKALADSREPPETEAATAPEPAPPAAGGSH
ncbi:YihY/virulence factor BrkB family protein [Corticibacter populi]|uniref:YihY/virulence factor BrkB family protein n=1 Tax=Corticibacter populi TaxID=1550736 RepID=A0A3M6QKL4_9BURK|nr:YihY/virulence factor BrkB family protein [Corticibacter populi]RMX03567.1 YihY/virulence factor BrkB family protein [Corticibacter populi]RZS30018.1 membrane protein [Corticibacter populi]